MIEQKIHKNEVVEVIAELCHEMNRTYCLSMGDTSQPRWAEAPAWQKESARLGVSMVIDNPDTTPEDSHKSWMKQKKADGWRFGPSKDPMRKEHPCMVSYAKLPKSQQIKDLIFITTVKTMLQDVEFQAPN
jgi:hypothetical protein